MREIKYTREQINEILANKYVKSCTNKNIIFTKECKLEALKLEKQLIFRKEIFKKLGFPEYVINSEIPTKSIDRWKRNVKLKGLIEESKGRPKKEKVNFENMTLEQENEYLRAKLAYYEEIKEYINSGLP